MYEAWFGSRSSRPGAKHGKHGGTPCDCFCKSSAPCTYHSYQNWTNFGKNLGNIGSVDPRIKFYFTRYQHHRSPWPTVKPSSKPLANYKISLIKKRFSSGWLERRPLFLARLPNKPSTWQQCLFLSSYRSSRRRSPRATSGNRSIRSHNLATPDPSRQLWQPL